VNQQATIQGKLTTRWPWLPSSILFSSSLLLVSAVLMLMGVSARESISSVGVVWLNALPFSILWIATVRRGSSALEALAIGIALSSISVILLNLFFVWVGIGMLPWWLLPVCAIPTFWFLHNRGLIGEPPRVVLPELVAGVLAILLALLVHLPDIKRFPLYGTAPLDVIHPDLYVFESMGNAIARFGASESGVISEIGYRYHWFTYAWSGWLGQEISAEPLVILARVLPVVSIIGLAALAAALASRMFTQKWAPALAAVALVVGTSYDYFSGAVINWTSPSHSLSGLWLLALIAVCVDSFSSHVSGLKLTFAVLLSVAAMGGKVSHGVIAVAGISMLLFVSLIKYREWRRPAWILWLAIVIPAGLTFIFVESGQPGGGSLSAVQADPSTGGSALYGWLVAVAAVLIARSLRWLGLGYAMTQTKSRQWPIIWWALGSSIAAVFLATVLHSTFGTEQWFLESAAVPVSLASAFGVIFFLEQAKEGSVKTVFSWNLIIMSSAALAAALIAPSLFTSWANTARPYFPGLVALAFIVGVALIVSASKRHESFVKTAIGWSAVGGLVVSVLLPVSQFARAMVVDGGQTPQTRIVYSWAADSLLERAATDPAELSFGAQSAAWLKANTPPDASIAALEPTTAWLSALSGRRLFASFPEQIKAWSFPSGIKTYETRRAIIDSLNTTSVPNGTLSQLCSTGATWIWGQTSSPAAIRLGSPTKIFGGLGLWPTCTK
jgi:hypothetical protein